MIFKPWENQPFLYFYFLNSSLFNIGLILLNLIFVYLLLFCLLRILSFYNKTHFNNTS